MMPVLGIDFGTTYTCVAAFSNGKVDVITNEQEKRVTPSYVAFNENERLYGNAAIQQAFVNMKNTIYGIKNIIGRCSDELLPSLGENKVYVGYEIIQQGQKLVVKVNYGKEEFVLTPEEISAMLLTQMKKFSEKYFGHEIVNVVISVPSCFNNSQRIAVMNAGKIAGFNILSLINEPTAAVISYGIENKISSSNVLVFDLGGGSFDVSIVNIVEGIFRVGATRGDRNFGGDDFDYRMVEHFAKEFEEKYKIDMSEDKRAMNRLRIACEKAKRTLSGSEQASIRVDSLFSGKDFDGAMTRVKFEELCDDLLQRAIGIVNTVIEDNKIAKHEIDDILLVGGSTRIPKLRSMLSDYFGGKELNRMINPDEAVACGAAYMAGNLMMKNRFLRIHDISSYGIGYRFNDKNFTKIISVNEGCPTQEWLKMLSGYPSPVEIQVCEFWDSFTDDVNSMASFQLYLSRLENNEPFEISFKTNQSGILHVQGYQNNVPIKTLDDIKGSLSSEVMKNMLTRVSEFDMKDENWRENSKARNALENYVYTIKKLMRDRKYRKQIPDDEKKELTSKCDETLIWIENNNNAEKQVSKSKLVEIEKAWLRVLFRIDPQKANEIRDQKQLELKQKQDAMKALEESVTIYKDTINEPGYSEISTGDEKSISQWICETAKWFIGNTEADVTEIEQKTKEYENRSAEIFGRLETQREVLLAEQKALKDKKKHLGNTVNAIKRKMKEEGIEVDDAVTLKEELQNAQSSLESNSVTVEQLTQEERRLVDLFHSVSAIVKKKQKMLAKQREECRIEARGVFKDRLRSLNEMAAEFFDTNFARVEDIQKIKKLQEWIARNPDADIKTLEEKDEELVDLWNEIVSKFNEASPALHSFQNETITDLRRCICDIIEFYRKVPDNPEFGHISPNDRRNLIKSCDDAAKWLENNQNEDVARLFQIKTTLTNKCVSIMEKYPLVKQCKELDDTQKLPDEISTLTQDFDKLTVCEDIKEKEELRILITNISQYVDEVDRPLIKEECVKLRVLCEETNKWLLRNHNIGPRMYKQKIQKINKEWDKLMSKLYEREKKVTSSSGSGIRRKIYSALNAVVGKNTQQTDVEQGSSKRKSQVCGNNSSIFKREVEISHVTLSSNELHTEKTKLTKYRSKIYHDVLHGKYQLRREEKAQLESKCREIATLISTPNVVDAEEYSKKLLELQDVAEPVLKRLKIKIRK